MTLIIAGYERSGVDKGKLFFLADSAITRVTYDRASSHRSVKTLLNGYRKFYAHSVSVFKPKFGPGHRFERYYESETYGKCLIAFAGGKDTAHHVLSNIELHLRNIKVAFGTEVELVDMLTPTFKRGDEYFSLDDYNTNNVRELLSLEFISKVIETAIIKALDSARQYKLDYADLLDLKCEFLAGIYCEKDKRHYLMRYQVDLINPNIYWETQVTSKLIKDDEIGFIGIKKYGDLLDADFQVYLNDPSNKKEISYYWPIEFHPLDGEKGIERLPPDYQWLSPVPRLRNKFKEIITICRENDEKEIDYPLYEILMDQSDIKMDTIKEN